MANYIGFSPEQLYGAVKNRFFYGIRRTDNGELFFAKIDQLKDEEAIEINRPGDSNQDFPGFEEGQDFYEGRDVTHNLVYENLTYEQFKWDDRDVFYYVNSNGELVLKTNRQHTYQDNVSSDG